MSAPPPHPVPGRLGKHGRRHPHFVQPNDDGNKPSGPLSAHPDPHQPWRPSLLRACVSGPCPWTRAVRSPARVSGGLWCVDRPGEAAGPADRACVTSHGETDRATARVTPFRCRRPGNRGKRAHRLLAETRRLLPLHVCPDGGRGREVTCTGQRRERVVGRREGSSFRRAACAITGAFPRCFPSLDSQ